jgi:hypothetical protein
MKPEQLALAAHVDQIVRNAGKVQRYPARTPCLRDPFLKDDSIETINHNSDTYLLCRPIARPSQVAQPAAKADK